MFTIDLEAAWDEDMSEPTLQEMLEAAAKAFAHVPGFEGTVAEYKGLAGVWVVINGQHVLVEEWPPVPPAWSPS